MTTWTEFLRTRRSMNIMGMTRKVCTLQWCENEEGKVALCKVDELRDQTQHDIYEVDGRKFWRGACLG